MVVMVRVINKQIQNTNIMKLLNWWFAWIRDILFFDVCNWHKHNVTYLELLICTSLQLSMVISPKCHAVIAITKTAYGMSLYKWLIDKQIHCVITFSNNYEWVARCFKIGYNSCNCKWTNLKMLLKLSYFLQNKI